MTWGDVSTYVGHVDSTGVVYRGVSPWDGLWATWQTLWPWHGRPWNSRTYGAGTGVVARRKGRIGTIKVSGKVNRRRRQYLNRARKAARRQARERGRRAVGEHADIG